MNKLVLVRVVGEGSGSKVLIDFVEGFDEFKVVLELRFKIDKNYFDFEGRYMIFDDFYFSFWLFFFLVCCILLIIEDCRDFWEYGEMVL